MVDIKAGYSEKAKENLKEIAFGECVDIYDNKYAKYFSHLIDTSDFVNNLGRELANLLIPPTVRQFKDTSLAPRTQYSYINKGNHYDLVSRIEVGIKQPNNLMKKIRIKQKIDSDYTIKDIGRIRIVVKDDQTAYQFLNSIQKGALRSFISKNGYILKEVEDHIKEPKSNGYKALHLTTASGYGSDKVCEIQIMPQEIYNNFEELHKQYKAEQEAILKDNEKIRTTN